MKTAIIVKAPGQLVPADVMKSILHHTAPLAAGFAVAADDNGTDTILVEHWPDLKEKGEKFEEILTAFDTLQNEMKDFQMLAALTTDPGRVTTSADGEIETPHMPPFLLLEGDNGVIHLVGAVAGDFGDSSGFPAHFNAMSVMLPGIKKSFRLLKHDVPALMDEFREDPDFIEQLKKLSETGVFSLLASNGDLFTAPAKDGLITTTPWGWTTFTAPAAEATKPMGGLAAKAKGLAGRISRIGGAKPEPTKVEPVIDTAKADPTGTKKTDTAVTVPVTFYQYPDKSHSKDQKRQGYLKNAGYIPPGFKNCPKVEVKFPEPDTKDLKQLDKVVAKATNADAMPEPANIKVTSTNNAPPAKASTPIIPAEMKEELINDPVVLQTLDKASGVLTPLVIASDEEKYPSFFEQTGVNIDDLYKWSFDEIKQFNAKFPDARDVLTITLLALHARHEQQNGKGTPATKSEPTVDEAKPTPSAAPSAAAGLRVRPKLAPKRAVA